MSARLILVLALGLLLGSLLSTHFEAATTSVLLFGTNSNTTKVLKVASDGSIQVAQ